MTIQRQRCAVAWRHWAERPPSPAAVVVVVADVVEVAVLVVVGVVAVAVGPLERLQVLRRKWGSAERECRDWGPALDRHNRRLPSPSGCPWKTPLEASRRQSQSLPRLWLKAAG